MTTPDIVPLDTPLSFESLASDIRAKSTRFMTWRQLQKLVYDTLEPLFLPDTKAFQEASDALYEELNQSSVSRLMNGVTMPPGRITEEEVHIDELLSQARRQRKNGRGFKKYSELSGKDLAAMAGVEARNEE